MPTAATLVFSGYKQANPIFPLSPEDMRTTAKDLFEFLNTGCDYTNSGIASFLNHSLETLVLTLPAEAYHADKPINNFNTHYWDTLTDEQLAVAYHAHVIPIINTMATTKQTGFKGETPLMLAAKHTKTEVVKLLVAHPGTEQQNWSDNHKKTALMYAIDIKQFDPEKNLKQIETVGILLDTEWMPVNLKDMYNATALDAAEYRGCKTIIEMINNYNKPKPVAILPAVVEHDSASQIRKFGFFEKQSSIAQQERKFEFFEKQSSVAQQKRKFHFF